MTCNQGQRQFQFQHAPAHTGSPVLELQNILNILIHVLAERM